MTVLQLTPAAIACLLLAAHFYRAGIHVAAIIALVPVALLFVRRRWAARVIQVALVLGALEWLRATFMLVQERAALRGPVLRLSLILGGVAAFTLAGAWLVQARRARSHFRLDAGSGFGGGPMSLLRFTKMQGLGNDFVVLDGVRQQVALTPEQLRRLSDRRFGVGCDQILLVEAATQPGVDFKYRIFNCDGGEVEQCGNGARCFVKFVRDQGLTAKKEIRVETAGGIIAPTLCDDGRVRVDMGVPRFAPAEVPFVAEREAITHPLDVDGAGVDVSVLSMGNPHAVQVVADVDAAPVTTEGPRIEHHARFPQRVNAGYLQVIDRGHIRLRVWERGAGETLACGTGACAAVVAGIRRGLLDSPVCVRTRGGELDIEWKGPGAPVLMTGPAVTVFEGRWEIPPA